MTIQIFGTKKCNDTKKAERFFKERKTKCQLIDLKEKSMSGFAAVPELWDTEEEFNSIRDYVHWAGLVYQEDYEEKSKYVSTANEYAEEGRFNLFSGAYTDTGYDNTRYEIVNGNETAIGRQCARPALRAQRQDLRHTEWRNLLGVLRIPQSKSFKKQ